MNIFLKILCALSIKLNFLNGANENRNEWELKARDLNCDIQEVLHSVCEMIEKTRALSFDGRCSVVKMSIKIKPKKWINSAVIGLSEEAVNVRLAAPPRKFREEYIEVLREFLAEAFEISGDDIIIVKASKQNMKHVLMSKEATSVTLLKSQLKKILTDKYKAVREAAIQKSLETTTAKQDSEEEYYETSSEEE